MSTDQLREASTVLQQGDKNSARLIIKEVLNNNPKSERGWMLLAKTSSQPSKIRFCLQQVLRINPENEEARNWLEELPVGVYKPPPAPGPSPTEPPQPAPRSETRKLIDGERGSLEPDEATEFDTEEVSEAEWEAIEPTLNHRLGEILNEHDDESKEIDSDLAPSSTGWTWRCSPDGIYTAISPSVYQILGYKAQEFYGQPLASFGLTFKSQIALDLALQNPSFPTEIAVEFRTAFDEIVPVNLHILPYSNDEDVREGLHGFTEVLQNISDDLPESIPEDQPYFEVQVEKPAREIQRKPPDFKPRTPIETKILSSSTESDGFGMFMRAAPSEEVYEPENPNEYTPTVCPFIGLSEDRNSRTAFPSPSNFCYAVERPRPIKVSYQSNFCLAKNYLDCRVYQGKLENKRASTRLAPASRRKNQRSQVSTILLISFTVLGLTIIALLAAYLFYMSLV